MIGTYSLYLANKRVRYEFWFSRSISVLNGDSSTGKSEFVSLLSTTLGELRTKGRSVADYETSFKEVYVVRNDMVFDEIYTDIRKKSNCLVVADEDTVLFDEMSKLADLVTKSDCYFLFITRIKKGLGTLPYSVNDVYEMVTVKSRKRVSDSEYVTTLQKSYSDNLGKSVISPDLFLTEDVGSGYDFVSHVLPSMHVGSIKGKDRLSRHFYKYLKEYKSKNYRVISLLVDGAAFGSNVYVADNLRKTLSDVGITLVILCPESFEWLILQSKRLSKYVDKNLLIDSRRYLSWERYFTKELSDILLNNFSVRYNKSKCNYKVLKVLLALDDGFFDYFNGDDVEVLFKK